MVLRVHPAEVIQVGPPGCGSLAPPVGRPADRSARDERKRTLRVCVVFDCLFPWTIGGAERQYRRLCEDLVAAGHQVTYLTRLQWDRADPPVIDGVEVVAVSGTDELYDDTGARRIAPALRFAAGVFGHLVHHRRSYDAVHVCMTPVFSVLAARAALLGSGRPMGVDWLEVWSPAYWRSYLGGVSGRVAALVQRLAIAATPLAFVYSQLSARNLRATGFRGRLVVCPGLIDQVEATPTRHLDPPPYALYVGRHIPEKRAASIPAAVAVARRTVPDLTAVVLGDGPARPDLDAEITRLGLADVVSTPGFVDQATLHELLAGAACLVLPSSREGFGLVVVEANANGTPAVVVAGPDDRDNAAAELVEPGVNGFVAPSTDPEPLGAAIVAVVQGGDGLRASTLGWFERNREPRSMAASFALVRQSYGLDGGALDGSSP